MRRTQSGSSSAKFLARRKLILEALATVFIAFLLSFGIREFVIQSFYIPSGSMLPTLQIDEHILVDKSGLLSGPVSRGDIVVFRDPGGWMGPEKLPAWDLLGQLSELIHGGNSTTGYLVKRVMGVGGDNVACCDAEGKLTVNGRSVDEPYISEASKSASDTDFAVRVPEGKYWVLGDNRVGSTDSRDHQDLSTKGFVSEQDLVGVVVAVSLPLSAIRWLLNPDPG